MTLYWWMHWFWITFELISCLASAHSMVESSTEAAATIRPSGEPWELNATTEATDSQLFCNESSDAASNTSVDVSLQAGSPGLPAASIAALSLGLLSLAGLVAAASFLLYRRRFANKPQTLNDKCSNLDSSGYIDDSSIRDNSEEMYSLDNDSFLNSLEAMTIQNYWTDNLKHTKL